MRRLRWLARVPGAPHVFDTMLLAMTGLFHPARLRAISTLETEVSGRQGMTMRVHRFGGIGFFVGEREAGHIHGNGLLDCFVGSADRDALVQAGRALPHHLFPKSGWISFWIEEETDVPAAIELIRIAAARLTAE